MNADVDTMNSVAPRRVSLARQVRTLMPYVLLAAMLIAFFAAPPLSDHHVGTFNVFNTLQNWSSVGLLALGVGLTMIAGEFDLGALGVYAVSGILAIKVGEHNAFLGIAAAVGVGVFVGFAQGTLVARLRINSMPVGLGFYIALLGTTMAISNNMSVSFSNLDAGMKLDAAKFVFFSWRNLIAIALFAATIIVMRYTRLGREVRAIGGDRRAARVVGVGVDRVLISVFVMSGLCASVGGSLLAYSLATALPDPGLGPLTFAVTAVLLGGVSLAGGSGTALGIALGSIALSLLKELFSVLAAPDYVEAIVRGALLVVATIIAAPELISRWKSLRAPRARAVLSAASGTQVLSTTN